MSILGLTTTYILEFDVAAIILTMMLLYTMLMRRTFPTKAMLLYKLLLICNIVSAASDIVSCFTICNPESFSALVNNGINIVYLFTHNFTGILFMLYIIAAIRGNLGTLAERIAWMSAVATTGALVFTSPYTEAIFYFDANGVYCHGPLFPCLYVMAVGALFYAVYLIVTHRSMMSGFQMGTNFAFILLIMASLVFQALNPSVLVECFIIAVACIMMNVALDNPATYFYQNTSCYNQSAFDITVEQKLASKADFTLIAFIFDDLPVFRKQFTDADYEMLMRNAIRRCQKIAGSKRVFVLQDSTFVLLVQKEEPEQVIRDTEEALSHPVLCSGDREVTMDMHFCLLRFPGAVETVSDVNLVIQDMLTRVYRKTGQHVGRETAGLLDELRREDNVTHVLRSAIRNDGIKVLFQPILNCSTGKFGSAEALVRLRDNTMNLFPDEFIPIAEQNGLILDIGEAVMRLVCRFLQESRCEDFGIRQIHVNLSMLQLAERSTARRLVEICESYGVDPKHIIFEITETATENVSYDDVLANVNYLKETGFGLSLDDYGSGYSHIMSITRFPFDQVKLDKSLLWGAMKDAGAMIALENMVSIVRNFGKLCIVEGVEDEGMERVLKALGVDQLQGYLYSKPISSISLLAFLREKNDD